MQQAKTDDVRRLYENYPYPFSHGNSDPDMLLSYLFRGYFLLDPLAGCRILDAGCGTGHKLAGLARAYPQAQFVGLELSGPSVEVARALMQQLKLSNVVIRHGNIAELGNDERYDVVQAFGVVHHLEDPQKGLNNLSSAVAENGMLAVWLYHPLGEFERLNQRALLHALWANWNDMAEGQRLMELLGLDLAATHYGPRYGPHREANPLEANADAFMHPIVNAYRFAEALEMVRSAGMDWAAVDFINMEGNVRLLNLGNVDDPFTRNYCLRASDLFTSEPLMDRYGALSLQNRLSVIELKMRPRGFQMLAGRGQSYRKLPPRLQGNVVELPLIT